VSDKVKYVLPSRWLYKLTNHIIEDGEQRVQETILIGIIQNLKPELYRDVLRSIIKVIYASGNEVAAGRLSEAIVRGFDYINGQKLHKADMRKLCG
jgi:hypothetical protein